MNQELDSLEDVKRYVLEHWDRWELFAELKQSGLHVHYYAVSRHYLKLLIRFSRLIDMSEQMRGEIVWRVQYEARLQGWTVAKWDWTGARLGSDLYSDDWSQLEVRLKWAGAKPQTWDRLLELDANKKFWCAEPLDTISRPIVYKDNNDGRGIQKQ